MADVPQEVSVSDPAPRGMSFRVLLAIVLSIILALSVAVILFSLGILRAQVIGLLPENLMFGVDAAFRQVLWGQALMLFTASLIFLGSVYFIIGSLVARPLRELTYAMDQYATTGTRVEVPDRDGVPREILSLNSSFGAFVDRVEHAHSRDTEMSRMKSDFISTAAHQFRTPLTGIRWALEALEKENLTEDQQALVKSAVDKSRDLVGIVGTLLDISSIESGKYHYTFAPIDIDELALKMAHDFQELATKRGVSLFFEGKEQHAQSARADLERIKWVLNNLIENAIRYTPSGGSVRIAVEGSRDRIYLKVRDTGIGIPAQDRGNIFERFYRSSNAVAKENAGNGLGLYIARTIAKDHGGDLSFSSNEGGAGTTFTLSLPVA